MPGASVALATNYITNCVAGQGFYNKRLDNKRLDFIFDVLT
jgi:hypothetical protein